MQGRLPLKRTEAHSLGWLGTIVVMLAAQSLAPPCRAADSLVPAQREGVYAFTDEVGVTHLSNVPRDGTDTEQFRLLVETSIERHLGELRGPRATPSPPLEIRKWSEDAAKSSGLEVALLYAVMWAESGFDAHARSRRGAQGIMQFMPETARLYGVRDPFDPRTSIFASARYLRELLDRYRGDLRLALAAYNAGPMAVARNHDAIPPYAETQAYVPRVIDMYLRLGGRDLADDPAVTVAP